MTFDRSLPSQHLYLGAGSEVQGRTMFDEDEVRLTSIYLSSISIPLYLEGGSRHVQGKNMFDDKKRRTRKEMDFTN